MKARNEEGRRRSSSERGQKEHLVHVPRHIEARRGQK